MTILLAQIEDGKAYIGTDSLCCWGDEFKYDCGPKFIKSPIKSLIIACAGDDSFTEMIEEALTLWAEKYGKAEVSTKTLRRLSEMIHAQAQRRKVGSPKDNCLPEHDFGLIIGYKGRLWTIDGNYAVSNWDSHLMIAHGSGHAYGIVVMDALWDIPFRSAKERLKKAIEIVCNRHQQCGGKAHIRST